MAVIRKYETKDECVGFFIDEDFDLLDSTIITEFPDWEEHWSFVDMFDPELYDEDYVTENIGWYDEDAGLMYYKPRYTGNGAPAWNDWFVPSNSFMERWCLMNLKEVCECGFVLVMHDDEFYALAVDGAGYSFKHAHFEPLYDSVGLKWHE